MKRKKCPIYLLMLVVLSMASLCHGAAVPQLTLIPSSSANVFTLQGSDLKDISALDIEFSYDVAVMNNPKAVRGNLVPTGWIFDFNPSVPGEIRLITKTGKININGSGTIVTISLDGVENAEGSLRITNTNLISNYATSVVARVQVLGRPKQETPPALPGKDQEPSPVSSIPEYNVPVDQPVTTPSNQTRPVAQSPSTTMGTVTLPGNQPEKEAVATSASPAPADTQPPVRQMPASQPHQREVAETAKTVPATPLKSVSYPSVLERFREYGGSITPQTLTALFKPTQEQIVRQEPAVALTDGEGVVSLRVELPSPLNETPSFSLRKASIVSLQQSDDGSWLILAKPLKDTIEARLTINCDGKTIQFPLVVAPPIDPALVAPNGSAEDGFVRYLKLKGAGKEARFDLNHDGKSDYLDDYIFTANFLAGQTAPKPEAGQDKLP